MQVLVLLLAGYRNYCLVCGHSIYTSTFSDHVKFTKDRVHAVAIVGKFTLTPKHVS